MLQGFVIDVAEFSSKLQEVFERLQHQDVTFTEEKTTLVAIIMKCLYHCCFKTV